MCSSLLHVLKLLCFVFSFHSHLVTPQGQLQLNSVVSVEGAILKASCPAANLKTHDWVKWYIGDQLIEDGRCDDYETTAPNTESHRDFCMRVGRQHHNKQLKCIVKSPENTVVMSQNVFVKYVELSLDPDTYNVGDKISAKCVVRNSLNAKVSWFVDDEFIKNATNPTMSFDEINNAITVRFLGQVTADDNGRALSCEAEIEGLDPVARSMQVMNVKGPLVAVDSHLKLNADVFVEGAILKTSCPAADGRPEGAVQWFVDDLPVQDGDCAVAPRSSELHLLVTRSHHGKVLRCVAGSPKQQTYVTKTMFVKYVELSLDSDTYNVGDKISAKCVVRNSLNAKVSWFVDDEFIKNATDPTMSFDKINNAITVRFLGQITAEENGRALSCEAEIEGLYPVARSKQFMNVKDVASLPRHVARDDGHMEDGLVSDARQKMNESSADVNHKDEEKLPWSQELMTEAAVIVAKAQRTKYNFRKLLSRYMRRRSAQSEHSVLQQLVVSMCILIVTAAFILNKFSPAFRKYVHNGSRSSNETSSPKAPGTSDESQASTKQGSQFSKAITLLRNWFSKVATVLLFRSGFGRS